MPVELPGIEPDWPAPRRVRAFSTVRAGGVSIGPYHSLNLATHVEDDPQSVSRNRALLEQRLGLDRSPCWLAQVHGTRVLELGRNGMVEPPEADGSSTVQEGVVCTVMTADCLPVLLCDEQGTRVAAVHAGWRGLVAGVIESALDLFPAERTVLAWLGPAIGPDKFEVGDEVREQFCDVLPASGEAFRPARAGHWMADIYRLARLRLNRAGVRQIYGGGFCTESESDRFFSFRRDGVTGRMATSVWLADPD